jgi:hypothetical protein
MADLNSNTSIITSHIHDLKLPVKQESATIDKKGLTQVY